MMKHHSVSIILAFSLLLSIAEKAGSQDYTPFHLENSEWLESVVYPALGFGDGGAAWKYRTRNDTIVNGLVYWNLTKTNLCEYWPDQQGKNVYSTTLDLHEKLIGGLRESGKKVFYLNYTDNKEIILYDFDFEVGDTIVYDPNNFTIILEELAPISGHRHYKVVNKNSWSFPQITSKLTHGYGSSYGLFGSYKGGLRYLECFKLQNVPITPYCGAVCPGFVPTSVTDEDIPDILLAPNPVEKSIFLTNTNVPIKMVEIFRASGEPFARLTSGSLNEIDVSACPSGIYFIRITDIRDVKLIKKFVKI
ncbi:MAG: T9SS type A sorting domain-containing protein [Saprospiraceae bacterium]|jgi:hypothetical protein|nr:T9SS type A sorting domain-containing protein [Saprospiraceae bacterium]